MIAHLDITPFSSACVSALASAAYSADGKPTLYPRSGRGSRGPSRDHLFVRKRCSMNHADFWVTPISLASCIELMPLREVTRRYMAYTHLSSGILERQKLVA